MDTSIANDLVEAWTFFMQQARGNKIGWGQSANERDSLERDYAHKMTRLYAEITYADRLRRLVQHGTDSQE